MLSGEEAGRILAGLVRIGTVMNVDKEKRLVRVKYEAEDMTSGWLYVLQHRKTGMYSGSDTATMHNHLPESWLTYWLPELDDKVLVLYLPVFNADGFVLGGF